MPIEPPDPTKKILDKLQAVLAELQEAACARSADPRLLPAVGHVGAAVALLATPNAPETESPACDPPAPLRSPARSPVEEAPIEPPTPHR